MVAFATQVKRRRGTTAQNDAFTGAEGEIVVDTQKHTLRVHDGKTQGGFEMLRQADLDNKADTDLGNIPANYDYVVESQFSTADNDNGYTWYRKYKSGWVEQGGAVPVTSPYGLKTVVFPVAMSSTNFTVSFSVQQTSDNTANITYRQGSFWNLTTTSFDCYDDDLIAKHWQVSGMSA